MKYLIFVLLLSIVSTCIAQQPTGVQSFPQAQTQGFSQAQTQGFPQSQTQSFSQPQTANNNQSQSQQMFQTPNMLESYRFGSFSPFSNPNVGAQYPGPIPQIQKLQSNKTVQLPKNYLRTKIKIDIEYKKSSLVEIEQKIYNRVSRIIINKPHSNILIEVNDRTATIRGKISSDEDLFLIQALISLEPGIDNIIDKTSTIK